MIETIVGLAILTRRWVLQLPQRQTDWLAQGLWGWTVRAEVTARADEHAESQKPSGVGGRPAGRPLALFL